MMTILNSCNPIVDRKATEIRQHHTSVCLTESSVNRERDTRIFWENGHAVCCLVVPPFIFYCRITILVSSNLYFCCLSILDTIIRAGR